VSLLGVPPVPGSSPTRWLIGWRRLWIMVVAISLPITLFSASRLNPRSELKLLLDAEAATKRAAYEHAFERVTGESVNASLSARLGTAESDTFAVEGNIQRYLEILASPDTTLRAEIESIERDFRPKIDRAYGSVRLFYWIVAAIWAVLCLSTYAVGASARFLGRQLLGGRGA
jgi:hypothetical protein